MATSSFLVPLLLAAAFFAFRADAKPVRWNIMEQHLRVNRKKLGLSLKSYCDGWQLNVELNNLRAFDAVPAECVASIGSYMESQYENDIHVAVGESSVYLAEEFTLSGDDKDAWIFDVDDTLLSTLPYFSRHLFGGEKINRTDFDEWKAEGNAPCIEEIQSHYENLKLQGFKIFIITSRLERLRNATVDNLLQVGYDGWARLIMRQEGCGYKTIERFKSAERLKLVEEGYRLWGVIGDQWSSLLGLPCPRRFFKLPNPMYYDV